VSASTEALRACRARKLSTSRMRRSAGLRGSSGRRPRRRGLHVADVRGHRVGAAVERGIVPDLAVTRGDVAHGLVPLSAEHGGLLASGRAARPRVVTRLRTCSRPGSVSTRAATSACRHLAAAAPIRTRQSVAEASMGVSESCGAVGGELPAWAGQVQAAVGVEGSGERGRWAVRARCRRRGRRRGSRGRGPVPRWRGGAQRPGRR
jgi:hypothetical protein